MNDTQKSMLLFLGGCIPARLALVALAKYMPINYLPYLGYATSVIGFGFLYLYITGGRKVGRETFGGKIWWMNFRIVHALFYLLFSFLAVNQNENAYLVLLGDAIFGLLLFLQHHFISS